MRVRAIPLLALWALLPGIVAVAAVPKMLTAPILTEPPKIDGKMNDWNVSLFPDEAILFLNKRNGTINVGDIADDKDFSATTYVGYEGETLYILAIATDDKLVDGNAADSNWKNDCIELWIDGANDVGAFPGQEDNVQINIDINGVPYVYRDVGLLAPLLPLLKGGAGKTADGWFIEASVPLSEIPNTVVKPGGDIGFSISFVDADDDWNHLLWLGANEVNINEWGDLLFSKETLAVDPRGRLATTWGALKR